VFLDHFEVLMLKIILKNKIYIYYFDTFLNEKYFKKQSQSHSQTSQSSQEANQYFINLVNDTLKISQNKKAKKL
jgi:hypothetical protein